MSENQNEHDSTSGAFKSGYSRGQIVTAILAAVILHGAIFGAYVVIGSEKKPANKAAEKTGKKADTAAAPTQVDGGKIAPGGTDTSGAATKTAPNPAVDPKKAEVAKPSELPQAPDSDIDAILKAK